MIERIQRVNHLIQKVIGEIIERDFRDTKYGIITITEVRISKDLRYAKVFFSVFGKDEQRQEALNLLKRKTKKIQQEVGSEVKIRYTPALEFVYDETEEKAEKINKICKELKLNNEQKPV